jgi:hypothetical protein
VLVDANATCAYSDSGWIESEVLVTDVNEHSEETPPPERTVTITGIPLLIAGVVAFVGLRRLRRRKSRRTSSD